MKKITKIGMVVAMEEEVSAFLQTLTDNCKTEKTGIYEVKEYDLSDKTLYVVKSGVGEICASGATELLAVKYGVELIINFGVCGSLSENLGLLDICVLEGVVHYDFDTSPIDNVEVGRYVQFPSTVIPCDKECIDLVKSLNPQIQTAICASGDKFIADKKVKEDLHSRYGANVCEMESAGILITSINNGIKTIFIKAISDGKGGAKDFNAMLDRATKQYISLIQKLLKAL